MLNIILLGVFIILAVVLLREEIHRRRVNTFEHSKVFTVLSHQLRTPLTSGKWYVELLMGKDFGSLSVAQMEALHEVDQGVTHAISILNHFLDRVRMGESDMQVQLIAVDLDRCLDTACANYARNLQEKKVELRRQRGTERVVALTDPLFLFAILDILLHNAVAYTPSGGTVIVTCSTNGERAVIEVADTGIGIPPAEQKQVFRRFFRGREAQLVAPHGDGLGLYLAGNILKRLKGSIAFRLNEGKGTVFTVTLPLATAGGKPDGM